VLGGPGHLVHPDLEQLVEPVGVEFVVGDAFDDPADGAPVDPHQPGDRALVGPGRKPRHERLEVAREVRTGARERDGLGAGAVDRAPQPPQLCMNLQAPHAEVQVPPRRVDWARVEAPATPVTALWADQVPAPQRDVDHDPSRLEPHPPNPDPVQAQQARECRREAHVVLPREPLDLHHQAASLTRPAASHAPGSFARPPVKGAAARLAALGPDGPPLTARLRSADLSATDCAARATHAGHHTVENARSDTESDPNFTHTDGRRRRRRHA
jgi:hypothetical protein